MLIKQSATYSFFFWKEHRTWIGACLIDFQTPNTMDFVIQSPKPINGLEFSPPIILFEKTKPPGGYGVNAPKSTGFWGSMDKRTPMAAARRIWLLRVPSWRPIGTLPAGKGVYLNSQEGDNLTTERNSLICQECTLWNCWTIRNRANCRGNRPLNFK
jgi:hypothetical protein